MEVVHMCKFNYCNRFFLFLLSCNVLKVHDKFCTSLNVEICERGNTVSCFKLFLIVNLNNNMMGRVTFGAC